MCQYGGLTKRRGVQNRSSVPTAEGLAVVVTGAFSVFGWLLPDITFWWRFSFAVVFVVLVVDLCLRSEVATLRFPSPWAKSSLLSVTGIVVIGVILCNPLRKQYMNENLPPSFPFILGAPLGDNKSPVWQMFLEPYGPESVYNCQISFWDADRKNVERNWRIQHSSSFSPPGLTGGDSQVTKHFSEVDSPRGTVIFERYT